MNFNCRWHTGCSKKKLSCTGQTFSRMQIREKWTRKANKWKTHRSRDPQSAFSIDKSSRSSSRSRKMENGMGETGRWKSEPCTFHLLLAQYARKSRFQWLNIDWTNELNMHASHAQLNMHPIYLWASSISQPLGHLSIYLCVSVAVPAVCRELFPLVADCRRACCIFVRYRLTHIDTIPRHTHSSRTPAHQPTYTHTHWQSCILGQVIAMKIALSCQMQTAFSDYDLGTQRQWGVEGG